jgi:uncharacterized membrane protein
MVSLLTGKTDAANSRQPLVKYQLEILTCVWCVRRNFNNDANICFLEINARNFDVLVIDDNHQWEV